MGERRVELHLLHPVVLLLACGLLAFASCQTVPSAPKRASESSTMLIVPLEFRNETTRQLELTMSLNFDGVSDSKTGDLLDFGYPFGFVRGVEPGNHRITRMLVRWKASGQILQQLELDIPCALKPGTATILPVRMSVAFKSEGNYFTVYNLLPNQMAELYAELQGYQNMETWILEPAPAK
jgi:hypothetical protein